VLNVGDLAYWEGCAKINYININVTNFFKIFIIIEHRILFFIYNCKYYIIITANVFGDDFLYYFDLL